MNGEGKDDCVLVKQDQQQIDEQHADEAAVEEETVH
jgi:hypothetical protein